MATEKKKTLSASLSAATCALLGTTALPPVLAEEAGDWFFDTSLLYYGESDDRVQDGSLNLLAKRLFRDDRSLTLGFGVDALTGATPNGALQQNVAQTFTRPSGNDTYSVAAGALPLDDTFRDTRVSLTANWRQPLGRLFQLDVGASASNEYDYTHLGFNAKLARDFNGRNTTLSGGLAMARDDVDPVGGTPRELSLMRPVGDLGNRRGAQTKDILDLVIGLTQVISRNTIVQLNYSFSDASGYLTDPYRVLSVVDGTTGTVIPYPSLTGDDGPSHLYRFESRPDSRSKHSLYAEGRHFVNGKVINASYRYMIDDWEIDSHTFDFRLRWPLGSSSYLEPHFRYYGQGEADFYRVSLVDGDALPTFASNDYRLGNFDALTVGLKFGWTTRRDHDLSMRLEFYQQRGDYPTSQLIGSQPDVVAYPDMDAIIAQFSYRF